jgi:hypothetical protein
MQVVWLQAILQAAIHYCVTIQKRIQDFFKEEV